MRSTPHHSRSNSRCFRPFEPPVRRADQPWPHSVEAINYSVKWSEENGKGLGVSVECRCVDTGIQRRYIPLQFLWRRTIHCEIIFHACVAVQTASILAFLHLCGRIFSRQTRACVSRRIWGNVNVEHYDSRMFAILSYFAAIGAVCSFSPCLLEL